MSGGRGTGILLLRTGSQTPSPATVPGDSGKRPWWRRARVAGGKADIPRSCFCRASKAGIAADTTVTTGTMVFGAKPAMVISVAGSQSSAGRAAVRAAKSPMVGTGRHGRGGATGAAGGAARGFSRLGAAGAAAGRGAMRSAATGIAATAVVCSGVAAASLDACRKDGDRGARRVVWAAAAAALDLPPGTAFFREAALSASVLAALPARRWGTLLELAFSQKMLAANIGGVGADEKF